MQEQAITLEKLDEQILHALQIWPRVSWADLGTVLNVDPATASRHWNRMRDAGVAWLSGYAPSSDASRIRNEDDAFVSAVIELQVQPKRLGSVFEQLQRIEQLQIMRATLGEWNISLDWRGGNLDQLEIFVSQQLSHIKGVQATRSFAVTQMLIEGSSWRYEGLTAAQESKLKKIMREDLYDPVPFAEHWHHIDSSILQLVREDARMNYAELARRTDSVVATAKRHLAHMMRNRDLVVRCDVSRQYSSRPVTVRYFASIPVTNTPEVFKRLKEFADIRSCGVLLGKYNLMMNVWLESIYDASRFEAALARRIPTLNIRERDLVTRFYVHGGRRIDQNGLNYPAPKRPTERTLSKP